MSDLQGSEASTNSPVSSHGFLRSQGALETMTQLQPTFGPREDQVAALLATGATNSEIAHELGIAVRTVKAHCNRLFMRYGLTGNRHKRVRLVIMMSQDEPSSAPFRMSPRLIRVCDLVVLGLTNKEIAETIGTSAAVIKNYLRMIYDLTGTFSRLELAIFWNSRATSNEMDGSVPQASMSGERQSECA